MNFEEFCDRIIDGDIKPLDFLVLAAIIFAAILVVVGWFGCIIWFLAIIVSAICSGAVRLLMLIPCAIIFSILTAIIGLVAIKMDAMG